MPTADHINLRKNGEVRLVVDGEDHTLRRPKLGEYRRFREMLVRDEDLNLDASEMTDKALITRELQNVSTREKRFEREGEIIAWWREVVATLDTEGNKLEEEDDDLPTWFFHDSLIGDLLTHWRDRPPVPGR